MKNRPRVGDRVVCTISDGSKYRGKVLKVFFPFSRQGLQPSWEVPVAVIRLDHLPEGWVSDDIGHAFSLDEIEPAE